MKHLYKRIEVIFEKLTSIATAILGNSISFIIAVCVIAFWLTHKEFHKQDLHARIGDIILGLSFLSLFIIQKSFSRFSGSLHLKVNELVASHKPANNSVIDIEKKTEHEIAELSKEYSELVQQLKSEEDKE